MCFLCGIVIWSEASVLSNIAQLSSWIIKSLFNSICHAAGPVCFNLCCSFVFSNQEAPVVARASLFLECARFVHRCNRGNWPEWMKGHHVNITKRGLSRGRSPVAGNKRNNKLQWNAAKYFYQWGDVSPCPNCPKEIMCRDFMIFFCMLQFTYWY